MVAGRLEHIDCPGDVNLVNPPWLGDARANTGLGRLVVDNVSIGHERVDAVLVGNASLHELIAAVAIAVAVARRCPGGLDRMLFDPEIIERLKRI